jgi:hypothetical protein
MAVHVDKPRKDEAAGGRAQCEFLQNNADAPLAWVDTPVAEPRQSLAISACSGKRGQSPTVRCPHGNRCRIDLDDERFVMLPSPEAVLVIAAFAL